MKMKQTALITGAASGFEKAAVEPFYDKGGNVVLQFSPACSKSTIR